MWGPVQNFDINMTRILLLAVAALISAAANSEDIYTDQFVVHVDGGAETARELARKHGFDYLGEVRAKLRLPKCPFL